MYSYNPYYSEYLSHHGILGQRWGVRRYQNPDGTLTTAGRKRYSNPEAEDAAKRAKVAAALAVGLGVTAASIGGAYAINKYAPRLIDKTLSAGTSIQTISNSKEYKNGSRIYAAIDDKDKKMYEGLLGSKLYDDGNTNVYKVVRETTDKIKVASDRTGRKVMEELRKTDPEFDSYVKKAIFSLPGYGDDYARFNTALVTKTDEARKANEKFFNKLREKGYGAVSDYNDRIFAGNGYHAKNPVIIFDTNKLKGVSAKEISVLDIPDKFDEALKIHKKQYIKMIDQPEFAKTAAEGTAALAGIGITNKVVADQLEKKSTQKKSK